MSGAVLAIERVVYRSSIGRSSRPFRFTRAAAFGDYAAAKFWEAHPCDCDDPHPASGYPGSTCAWHTDAGRQHVAMVVRRYARLLMREARKVRLEAASPKGG